MSNTESFESVMERVNAEIAEIEAEDRPFPYRLSANVLRNLRDRLRRAHNREIRDVAQQEYDRGFNDGRHSMDAEHRAIAMRLRRLPLDGGNHENLSQIAHAVYHSDFGWTRGACAALRDELVRLMGGVSDENVHVGGLRCDDGCMGDVSNGEYIGRTHDSPSNPDRNHMAVHECVDTVIGDSDDTCACAGGGACAAGDGDCTWEQKEVGDGRTGDSYTRSHTLRSVGRNDVCMCRDSGEHSRGQEVEHGRAAHDCAADTRGGSGSELVHMDGLVTYDVLDNERHKAVCELWKLPEQYEDDGKRSPAGRFNEALGDAIGVEGLLSFAKIRDRLIHLLGGDQPSGIDVLREMDAESDIDGTCPNDVPLSSITDELRELIAKYDIPEDENHKWFMTSHDQRYIVTKAYAIADRIDEQLGRICQQHEAVLQESIDEVVAERDELETKLEYVADKLRFAEDALDRWVQAERDWFELLKDARDEYVNMQAVCDELRYQREELMRKWLHERAERKELQGRLECACREIESIQYERDGLQANLNKANGENKGLRLSIVEQKEAILQRKKMIKKLTRDNEKVWKTVHGLQAKLDLIRNTLDE